MGWDLPQWLHVLSTGYREPLLSGPRLLSMPTTSPLCYRPAPTHSDPLCCRLRLHSPPAIASLQTSPTITSFPFHLVILLRLDSSSRVPAHCFTPSFTSVLCLRSLLPPLLPLLPHPAGSGRVREALSHLPSHHRWQDTGCTRHHSRLSTIRLKRLVKRHTCFFLQVLCAIGL